MVKEALGIIEPLPGQETGSVDPPGTTPGATPGVPWGGTVENFSCRCGGTTRTPQNTHRAPRTGRALGAGRKHAAQLIPARRTPQATHGTYRGGSRVPGGVGPWSPERLPRRAGPKHHVPMGGFCPRGTPQGRATSRPPRAHHPDTRRPRAGRKRAARPIPARRTPQATHGTYRGESCSRLGAALTGRKRAARPVPARRAPQATHGIYMERRESGERRGRVARTQVLASSVRILPRTTLNHTTSRRAPAGDRARRQGGAEG